MTRLAYVLYKKIHFNIFRNKKKEIHIFYSGFLVETTLLLEKDSLHSRRKAPCLKCRQYQTAIMNGTRGALTAIRPLIELRIEARSFEGLVGS